MNVEPHLYFYNDTKLVIFFYIIGVQFAYILLRVFVSVYIREIGL